MDSTQLDHGAAGAVGAATGTGARRRCRAAERFGAVEAAGWVIDAVDVVSLSPDAARARRAVTRAVEAIEALGNIDVSLLDAGERRAWIEGVERARRMVDAASVRAAGEIDRSNPFREQGFFSARTVIRHMLQLSGPAAFRRVQTARMHDQLEPWRDAARDGSVGVDQTELMARVAANPRIDGDVLRRDQEMLLEDARTLPFDSFAAKVRTWESLADPVGDRDRNERQKRARDVMLRGRPDGGWRLDGLLTELDGCEVNQIFAWFIEAEWHTDWAEARKRLGDDATTADLVRTEAQRRADAFAAMARAAAAAPTGPRSAAIVVNILIDHETFEARVRGERRDPADYRKVVCRTQSGRRLHPDDAVNAALIHHVRRVVYDSAGVVIDLGRTSRLFRGPSREAVMLLATHCVWLGCDQPVEWCDADHSLGWRAHGATVPRNGGPLCHRHNILKERGFQVFRDAEGEWHVIDPDDNEIN